jgi:hypothetical protein
MRIFIAYLLRGFTAGIPAKSCVREVTGSAMNDTTAKQEKEKVVFI